ncbi:hypothetical protein M514_27444 [Trichuris suis]|uniref:Uncharacterized protein n=1 Tax=Trichuris suis TaxID=68888 RepID=A0A085MT52_9BILA|nr:hypothetical protein M514_27444 [Trichuris suis]
MCRYALGSFTARDITAAKRQLMQQRKEHFTASYQGYGFDQFGECCSNQWITEERMTGRNFILSIKARTNLVPTRLQTHRGRVQTGDQRILCRRCGNVSRAPESLTHVSQNRPFTYGLICRRHNMIAAKLISVLEANGFDCIMEPILCSGISALIPDILATKNGKSWIIDVAIQFEMKDSLARRHAEKCAKYEALAQPVKKLTEATDFATGAFVIGIRGAWCAKNDDTLEQLGITMTTNMKALLCLMVLERTNQLVAWFMRTSEGIQIGPLTEHQRKEISRTDRPCVRPD